MRASGNLSSFLKRVLTSHICVFVDDLLLFAKASEDQMAIIMECLDLFCTSSSQKISLQKSSIYFS